MTRLIAATAVSVALFIPTLADAQNRAPAAGSRPGDREMSCEAVLSERSELQSGAAQRSEASARNARRRSGLMGFARNMAASAAPSVLSGLGGGSYAGAIAAQAAGQAAGQALQQPATSVPVSPAEPEYTPDEQARLTRLAAIASYRECPAA